MHILGRLRSASVFLTVKTGESDDTQFVLHVKNFETIFWPVDESQKQSEKVNNSFDLALKSVLQEKWTPWRNEYEFLRQGWKKVTRQILWLTTLIRFS